MNTFTKAEQRKLRKYIYEMKGLENNQPKKHNCLKPDYTWKKMEIVEMEMRPHKRDR